MGDDPVEKMVNLIVTIPEWIAIRLKNEALLTEQTVSEVVVASILDHQNECTNRVMVLSNDGEPFIKPVGDPIPLL